MRNDTIINSIMDYLKHYKLLMTKAKNQVRKKGKGVYYEKHHIIPDFMFIDRVRSGPKGHLPGNPRSKENLVLLTPREHIVAHVLLFKVHENQRYGYQCGAALNFFFSKVMNKHIRSNKFRAHNSRFYEYCRKIGTESISRKNKGFVNVKHAATGKYFGRMNVNDSRYMCGEYVHHSKGNPLPIERVENMRKAMAGKGNSNYKEMTVERRRRVLDCALRSIRENHLIYAEFIKELKAEFIEFNKISYMWIRNNFSAPNSETRKISRTDTLNAVLRELNIREDSHYVFESYYRCQDTLNKMRKDKNNVKNKKKES